MVAQAVEGELRELLEEHGGRKLRDGRSAVVRNGYQPGREVVTGIGAVPVRIPRVRSRDGEPVAFTRRCYRRTSVAVNRWTRRFRGCS